jgi:hypothetical protein
VVDKAGLAFTRMRGARSPCRGIERVLLPYHFCFGFVLFRRELTAGVIATSSC